MHITRMLARGSSGQINDTSDDEEVVSVKDWHLAARAFQEGLILQHYGCPTASIDITSDAKVALWFALNTRKSNNGKVTFEPFRWSGSDPSQWPTVMVFSLNPRHPFLDTGTILNESSVLRPQRQNCGILGGAGNLARNYGARYISFKIRLAPVTDWSSELSAEYLFPGPDEDPALGSLLAAEDASKNLGNRIVFPVTQLEH